MIPTKAKPGAGRRRASQGVNAWTAANDAKHTAQMATARILALTAMAAARERLDALADEADADDPGIADSVTAADLLDSAIAALAGTP